MRDYSGLTREQAIALLIKRDATRKVGLVWERDEIVSGRTSEDDFVVANLDPAASSGNEGASNLILEGDNFDALRWLRMTHASRVKAIYIDPPYNRGKRDFIYDDDYVGPFDRFKHSKWLETADQRLRLAKDLLLPDGVIFVSIGDDEVHTLGLLMDQIFDERNRIGLIVWNNVTDNNPTRIASEHEYILCYARDVRRIPKHWKMDINPLRDRLLETAEAMRARHPDPAALSAAWKGFVQTNKEDLKPFGEYDMIDAGGPWTGSRSVHNPGKAGYRYDVPHPRTGKACKEPQNGYRFPPSTMKRLIAQDRIVFGKDENKIVELKLYLRDYRTKLSSVLQMDGRKGANELRAIFPDRPNIFKNPKPSELIAELLAFVTTGDDIVLDFYAGSGTTGHSVLRLNAEDGQARRFILVNQSRGYSVAPVADDEDADDGPAAPADAWGGTNICLDICAERVRRIAQGLNAEGFSYLRLARVAFENMSFDVSPEHCWTAIQAAHGLPVRAYASLDPLQVAGLGNGSAVVYCNKFTVEAERRLEELRAEAGRILVYSWAVGPLRERFAGDAMVEVLSVPDEMLRRFAA